MDAFTPTSTSPSHYSPQAIGFIIGAGAVALVLIIGWVYIARHGGPSKMINSFRERREAKSKARDIEAAANADRALAQAKVDKEWEAEQKAARQEALDQLNGLYAANNLVGSTLPPRPQQVDFEEERRAEEKEQERLKRVKKDEQLRAAAAMQVKEGWQARVEDVGKPRESFDLCRPKDSFELTIDPPSHTWGSGKNMAGMYRK